MASQLFLIVVASGLNLMAGELGVLRAQVLIEVAVNTCPARLCRKIVGALGHWLAGVIAHVICLMLTARTVTTSVRSLYVKMRVAIKVESLLSLA